MLCVFTHARARIADNGGRTNERNDVAVPNSLTFTAGKPTPLDATPRDAASDPFLSNTVTDRVGPIALSAENFGLISCLILGR